MLQELLLQTNGAEGQTHHGANAASVRDRDLAASAAEIDEQASGLGVRLELNDAQVNQPSLFESGDDLEIPASGRLDPLREGGRVARVAAGRRGDHPDLIDYVELDRFVKALERLDGAGHGFGRDHTGLEDALAEPGNLAVLVQRLQLAVDHRRNLEAAGVGANINRCKRGHIKQDTQRCAQK